MRRADYLAKCEKRAKTPRIARILRQILSFFRNFALFAFLAFLNLPIYFTCFMRKCAPEARPRGRILFLYFLLYFACAVRCRWLCMPCGIACCVCCAVPRVKFMRASASHAVQDSFPAPCGVWRLSAFIPTTAHASPFPERRVRPRFLRGFSPPSDIF